MRFSSSFLMRFSSSLLFVCVTLSASFIAGCPGDVGAEGELSITVNGEEAATDGFAASDLADGWAISFDNILVSLEHVTLTPQDGEEETIELESVIDLVAENGSVIGDIPTPEGRTGFGFVVAPPESGATGIGASSADITAMADDEFSFFVRGQGVKDGRTVAFELGFPIEATMSDCTNGVDDTDGVVVEADASTSAEITVHLEHLLYDKLGGHDGVELRFAAWADAAGDDDLLTTDELETAALSALPDYDPESVDVDNLHDFISDVVIDMFHLNGEGLCSINGEVHDHDDEDHDDDA